MEQKKSRLFALLLMTVLMITGIFAAPAGAWALEENKKENIKADSVTTDSIILKVEDGYEYAIQKKEKKYSAYFRRFYEKEFYRNALWALVLGLPASRPGIPSFSGRHVAVNL